MKIYLLEHKSWSILGCFADKSTAEQMRDKHMTTISVTEEWTRDEDYQIREVILGEKGEKE